MVRELLADYAMSARRTAGELLAAVELEDIEHIRMQAHKLKSSSRSVGAAQFADVCAEIENACSTVDTIAIARLVCDFKSHQIAVENAMNVLLRERSREAKHG
jgi:HPt (histidine-containing phosphotransfer) domain-containing protein